MGWKTLVVVMLLSVVQAGAALADELTQIVQLDLTTLGYDPGVADGNATTKTIIAVSKFQAEHNMDVTGEITPQLAGVIKAAISQRDNPASAQQGTAQTLPQMTPEQAQADLKARQQACLQEKIDAAQKSAQTRSGFGKLFNAVTRTASRFGGSETAAAISNTAGDAYSVNATINDLEGAAKDLGISETDIEACQNP
ncbi:MAG: peptidoglycan-binding domain-containing protein [Halioglobus sp.]